MPEAKRAKVNGCLASPLSVQRIVVLGAPDSALSDRAALEHVNVGTVTSFNHDGLVLCPSEVKGKAVPSLSSDKALTSKYEDRVPPNDILPRGNQVGFSSKLLYKYYS